MATPAPKYPSLPPLPCYTPPDPLLNEKVAYSNALIAGNNAIDVVGRAMFTDYLKHVESGNGKEGSFSPKTDEDVTHAFRVNVLYAFKNLLETIDPGLFVTVVPETEKCNVTVRTDATTTAAPTLSPATPASAPVLDSLAPADKAFSGSDKDKLAFLNEQLRRLGPGDAVWLKNNAGVFEWATLLEFVINKDTLAGTGKARGASTTFPLKWDTGYNTWPLSGTKLLPCWDKTHSLALYRKYCGDFKFATDTTETRELCTGDYIRVVDTFEKPYMSRIIDSTDRLVKVHYFGYRRHDEWIDRSSSRLGPVYKVDLSTGDKSRHVFLRAMNLYYKDKTIDEIAKHLATYTTRPYSFILTNAGVMALKSIATSEGHGSVLYGAACCGATTVVVMTDDENASDLEFPLCMD